MGCGYKKVYCVSLLLHVLAFTGSLLSIFTDYWRVFVADNMHVGLIWVCVNGSCTERQKILQFESATSTMDLTLVLFIGCCVATFISTILHIVIIRRSRYKRRLKISLPLFLFTFIGAASGMMGIVYSTFIKELFNFKSHITDTWSFYIACITGLLMTMACFLVLCTCCMQTIHRSSKVEYIGDAEIHSNAGTIMSAPPLEGQHAFNPHHQMPETPSYPQLQQQTSASYPQHPQQQQYPHQPQAMFQYPMQPVQHHTSYPQY